MNVNNSIILYMKEGSRQHCLALSGDEQKEPSEGFDSRYVSTNARSRTV